MDMFWEPISETIASVPCSHYMFEGLLVISIIWLLIRIQRNGRHAVSHIDKLSEKEKDELIAEWEPEPLVPDTPQDHPALNPKYVDGKMGKYVTIDGKSYLNLATSNFLGLVGDERIEEVAKETIYKYGVGSCGPRGFYGTVDVHLDLERELAAFFGCEEAVLYSYAFATVASAIPAYSKRGDVIFADKAVNFAIQKGLQASRSRIEWFEHNDMEDFERLLKIQAEKDKKNGKKAKETRRFMVVEGLYAKTGDVCPLVQLLSLKWKYKVRIFIDESLSFGVLGRTGRGVTEHLSVDVNEVDMIMGSLENAIASTGGFCVGRSYVVGHQRLSGLGYCFSASLPPLLATAAGQALRIIETEPDRLQRLRQKGEIMFDRLTQICNNSAQFCIRGSRISPFFHLQLSPSTIGSEQRDVEDEKMQVEQKLDTVVDRAYEKGFVLTRARYLVDDEAFPVDPSIRICVNSELEMHEIESFLRTLEDIIQSLSNDYSC